MIESTQNSYLPSLTNDIKLLSEKLEKLDESRKSNNISRMVNELSSCDKLIQSIDNTYSSIKLNFLSTPAEQKVTLRLNLMKHIDKLDILKKEFAVQKGLIESYIKSRSKGKECSRESRASFNSNTSNDSIAHGSMELNKMKIMESKVNEAFKNNSDFITNLEADLKNSPLLFTDKSHNYDSILALKSCSSTYYDFYKKNTQAFLTVALILLLIILICLV